MEQGTDVLISGASESYFYVIGKPFQNVTAFGNDCENWEEQRKNCVLERLDNGDGKVNGDGRGGANGRVAGYGPPFG
jgi:hypothetical protein